ncbi:MAG: monofunctional biosynthetic peptidoglycan transglycosylase [Nitrospirae bacterium]|nr:monofunctional biosynthetic peptidoglycan transglycosylase [Nitrospirota bacterium]
MPRNNKSFIGRFRIILLLLLVAAILGVCYSFIYPDMASLRKGAVKKTSFMEYREREWRREGKIIKIRQIWTPFSNISPFLVKAVLIGEDDKFWRHEGFDLEAMQKAMEKDLKEKKFKFGGSTISQQLAKNLFLTPSKNPLRKLREAILTWRMEKKLTKRRILELYLNVAEWGEGIFGIEAASRFYYGKPASALGPEEAAKLASVLPNPRIYNPLGTSRYVANRSRIIYNIMVKRGIVIPQYEEVISEPVEKETDAETPQQPERPAESSGAPFSPAVSPRQ